MRRLTNLLMVAALLGLAGSAFAAAPGADFSTGITGLGSTPVAATPDPEDAARAAASKAAEDQANQLTASGKEQIAAPTGATIGDESAYRLGAGDKVRVTVYGEDDLTGEFEIDSTGVLAMPLVGDVQAGNLTLRDLEKAITSKLEGGYLVNPRVSVEVLNFRPFFILGEVNKPGSYPYVNDLTVINAVALAGGYTTRAKTGYVYVKRASDPKREEVQIPEDAKVFPGDAIRVDERFF